MQESHSIDEMIKNPVIDIKWTKNRHVDTNILIKFVNLITPNKMSSVYYQTL